MLAESSWPRSAALEMGLNDQETPLGLWGRPALSASSAAADRVFDAAETHLLRIAQSTHSVSSPASTCHDAPHAEAMAMPPFHAHPQDEVALVGAAPLIGWQQYLSLCSASSPPTRRSSTLGSSPELLPRPFAHTLDYEFDE